MTITCYSFTSFYVFIYMFYGLYVLYNCIVVGCGDYIVQHNVCEIKNWLLLVVHFRIIIIVRNRIKKKDEEKYVYV